VRTESV